MDFRYSVRAALIAAAIGLPGVPGNAAWADVLVKNDGTRLEGDVRREGESWVVIGKDGSRTLVRPSEVKGIEYTGRSGGSNAEAGLASLRRASENQTDPVRVVERYRQFIETNKGTPVAEEAAKDLAVWEDRVARRMVKIAGNWVDEREAAEMKASATQRARQAMLALRESRLNDAESLLAEALGADPVNPTANYLRGVLLHRQDKLADARKAFDIANTAVPNHGPTLNNIAVTAFKLNQQALALTFYEQAMVALPIERGLLNNVAEALEACPDQVKNGVVWKRLKRKFDEQDLILAQRLAQQGLFRWGATWVTRVQLAELKAVEEKIKAEVDKLSAEYDQLTLRLTQIDSTIASNDRQLRDIELQSLRRDQNGNLVQLPLPNYYYTLRTQNDTLRAERTEVERQQVALRARAKEAQKQMPQPQYTGVQQLYAAEAAPIAVGASEHTAPPSPAPTTRP